MTTVDLTSVDVPGRSRTLRGHLASPEAADGTSAAWCRPPALHRTHRRHRVLPGWWLRTARSVTGVRGECGRDAGLRGVASRLEAALTRAGVVHDVLEYPLAGHSFLNSAPNGPAVLRPLSRLAHVGPNPPAADHAWQRIEAFFATHLRGED